MPELPERLPIAQAPLSIILLAFNAALELPEVLAAWDGYLASLSHTYEILLVDDGSTDATAAHAQELTGQHAQLKVLAHEQHLGVGASLRAGFHAARYPMVLTVPCDKQFQPPDLYRLLEAIDRVDLVTGYRVGRRVPTGVGVGDFGKRYLARIFLGAALEPRTSWPGWAGWQRRWVARWLFGVRVQDPECPFRLYRREILERLPIGCNSSAAQIEILAKANHLECIMAEVPVSWVPAAASVKGPLESNASAELRRLFFQPDFGPAPT